MTPLEDIVIADLKGWYGNRFDLLVREFRSEKYLPYSTFQLYISKDGVNGYPALALYKYIYPDAVAIARAKHERR
jgi:hypothetical protein